MTPAKQKTLTVSVVLALLALLVSIHFHLYARGTSQAATDSKQETMIEHNTEGVKTNSTIHREDMREIRTMHKEILERLPRK